MLALRAEGLGKSYRIGAARAPYRTLREALMEAAAAPARRARALLAGRSTAAAESEVWALREVSFDVKAGEAVGIIGRNGAGKSTLLKVLSRITEPTTGRVGLRGRVGSLLEVGTGFHPELTGRENVYLNGAILGLSRADIAGRFDQIVSFAELERFLDTPVKRYSSGMYMRLAFAVAAHLEPDILLVDEVLAVGDAEFQKKCLGRMDEVARQGRTVLFVSHNMHAVRRLCARGLWLEAGALRLDAGADEAVRAYMASASGAAGSGGGRRAPEDVREGRAAHFEGWRLDAAEPGMVESGGEVTLLFDVLVRERVRGAYFGVALWSEGDALVWAGSSHDGAGATRDLDPGRYRLRVALGRMPLAAGAYSLELSINTPEAQLDHWQAAPPLTVTSTRTSVLPERWQGLLQVDGHMTVERQ
jgi:lipopolysaccharide transport system ATP-binding protein